MGNLALPEVRHPPGTVGLVLDDGRRALVRRAGQLASPDREAIHHAARQRFEAACLKAARQLERRAAVEIVEIGADQR